MEQAHAAGAHQRARRGRERRLAEHLLVLGDPVPVAEVLDERARLARLGRVHAERAEIGEVALDAGAQRLDLVGREDAFEQRGPVALECVSVDLELLW